MCMEYAVNEWDLLPAQALWVLGSASTLQRSPVWAALLEDAQRRGKIVPNALARCCTQDRCSSSFTIAACV